MVQSHHAARHERALHALRAQGLAYPCFCSRAQVLREVAAAGAAPHGPDGAILYPGTCRGLLPDEQARRLDRGLPHAWRLDMAKARARAPGLTVEEQASGGTVSRPCDPAPFGDVVLWRREGAGSYHLCATADDAWQGVTLVTRAADLRPAAALHRLLAHLLDWRAPVYAHHRLLTDPQGRRLSKGGGARAIGAFRAEGRSAADVLALAGCGPGLQGGPCTTLY